MNPEKNGGSAPINRMPTDMLKRVRRFVGIMHEQGKEVYLGPSGTPFTIEGGENGVRNMEVDETAISFELFKRSIGAVIHRIREIATLNL